MREAAGPRAAATTQEAYPPLRARNPVYSRIRVPDCASYRSMGARVIRVVSFGMFGIACSSSGDIGTKAPDGSTPSTGGSTGTGGAFGSGGAATGGSPAAGGSSGVAAGGTGGSSASSGGSSGVAGSSGGASTGGAGAGGSNPGCPPNEPRHFDPGQRTNYDACTDVGSVCRYGTDCCSCNHYAGCATDAFWWCVPLVAGCPASPPTAGDACSTQGQSCVYCDDNGAWFQLCNAGKWAGRNPLGCT